MVSHSLQHDIQFVLFMVVKSYRELQIAKRVEVEFTMVVHCDLVRIWIKAVIAIHLLGLMNNLYDFEEQVEVVVEDHLEEAVVVRLEAVLEDQDLVVVVVVEEEEEEEEEMVPVSNVVNKATLRLIVHKMLERMMHMLPIILHHLLLLLFLQGQQD